VQRLTREQLADALIALLHQLQQEVRWIATDVEKQSAQASSASFPPLYCISTPQGSIKAAEEEEVLPAVLREAWFMVLKAAHRGKPRPGPYYTRHVSCMGPQLSSSYAPHAHQKFCEHAINIRTAVTSPCKIQLQCDLGTSIGCFMGCRLQRHTASGLLFT
jgi:hypothetical protein